MEPFQMGTRALPNLNNILREADDIEGSEEYDIDDIMSSYTSGNRVLYVINWFGWPNKQDWMPEPFNNFSVGGQEKLQEFYLKHPNSPRDYQLKD
jgi:hypothetical protein